MYINVFEEIPFPFERTKKKSRESGVSVPLLQQKIVNFMCCKSKLTLRLKFLVFQELLGQGFY